MVNGFGMFDTSLLDGQGGNPQQVTPGETLVLTLNLTGLGTIAENDFVTEFSELESLGGTPMIATAKFVNGPGDASGYGATNVPEPATLVLMLTTLIAVASRRR
jgi:hypothetical protein